MDRSRVAIVIPALNEAATIAAVVAKARSYGVPVVVDDGSSDNTAELAVAAGAVAVCHFGNLGYDMALNSGFDRATQLGCSYIVTMDADGQHDPLLLDSFLTALDQGADLVCGIRDRRQRIGEVLFAWFAKWKWGIDDPLCGMKAYRTTLFAALGHFDSYGSIGTELAIFAARRGARIVQLPVKTRDRADQPRFGRRFAANRRILRALWIGMLRPRSAVS